MSKKYDAIVVLGESVLPNGEPSEKGKLRCKKGVGLLKSGEANTIIFSGKHSYKLEKPPVKTEARAMLDYSVEQLGLNSADAITEENAVSTVTNLYYLKRLLNENGWRNVVLISETPHLERVKYNAEYVLGEGFGVEVVPSEFPYEQSDVDTERSKMPKVVEFFSKYQKGDSETIFMDAMAEVDAYLNENKPIY